MGLTNSSHFFTRNLKFKIVIFTSQKKTNCKMTKTKNYFTAAIILTAVIAGTFFVYSRNTSVPLKMPTIKVKKGDVESVITATGQIDTAMLVDIGAQVSGQIKTLAIAEGDRISQGQLIAEIDDMPQRNDLKNSQAALTVLRAEKESKLSVLRKNLLALKRQNTLYRQAASTREEYEDAQEAVITARADLRALKARTDQAQLEVDKRRLSLDYTRITAPVDGTIIAINTRVGQTVNASQTTPTIAKIAVLDKMNIRIKVSEADILKITPGQQARFTLYATPDRPHAAVLRSINLAPESILRESTDASPPRAEGAVYYNALLEVTQPDPRLRIGMTAQVTLVREHAGNALLIPTGAIQYDASKQAFVMVQSRQNAPRHQPIQIGLTVDLLTQVLDGLAEGDDIILPEKPSASSKEDKA